MAKDYNLNRHYESKHVEKYKHLTDTERMQMAEDLLAKLKKQQGFFTKAHTSRDAAVRTSFVISQSPKTASCSLMGSLLRKALQRLQHLYAWRKKEAFVNVPLSGRNVTRRIESIAKNLELWLQNKVDDFDVFSLALDKSCDVCDTAQLLIFVRGLTKNFEMMEELPAGQLMKGTTMGRDLFTELNTCYN